MKSFRPAFWLCLSLFFAAPARADQPGRENVKSAQMEYLRGTLLERRGAYAEALQAYEQAFSFDAQSGYIAREAAELSLDMGLTDKALQWANRVVELEPKSAQSQILLGRVQWARGETQAAQASFEAAVKLDPRSAESIFSLGSLLAAKSPEKAKALLERFLEENPSEAHVAHFQLAKLELQAGRFKGAEEHLKSAIALEPDLDSLPARYTLAQAYEAQQSTSAALSEYLEILKLEPRNVALLDHIGQLHFILGRNDEARARFEAAKSVSPDDPGANHWLALFAEHLGDYAKAAEYLRVSSALSDDPALTLRLSYYLTQAGRLKEAVSVLEGARSRWPANDQIAYFLALGYEDLKEDAKAVKLLRRVVSLKPDFRDARFQLAVLLERKNDMAGAEKEFRALLARKPDDATVLNYLGYSLADRGLKLPEAENLIREALRLDPKNGAYQDSLGWAHFKEGRSTEAVKELLSALALLPDDENVWDHLGDAYAVTGSSASAWFAWKKAESLSPPESRNPRKAAALQARFTPEEAGGYYLDYLNAVQGGIEKLTGLCRIEGAILGRSFSYSGIATFRAPAGLDVDLLGPLFTPMFRLRVNQEGFVMDPLRIEGLDSQAVIDAAYVAFSSVRDYLAGAPFHERPARYRKYWRSAEIQAPNWRISLSLDGMLAQTLWPASHPGYRVVLEDFDRAKGREVPRAVKVIGKDFALSLRWDNPKIEFQPSPLIQAAPKR